MRPADPGAARLATLVAGLLFALVLARLAGMHLLPLMDTTEARYAEIGRKMAQLGDWVTPWHDVGVPFWGKPPLSFWLTALSFRVLGVGEFAARLPHFLCAVGIALCTWRLGALRSRPEGLLAAALLAGSALFGISAGAVMTDGALVLGATLAMIGFWEGLQARAAGSRPQAWLLFVGAAIGLLAKGPLALVLIGVPLVAFTLATRQAAAVRHAFPWLAGTALVAVLTLPWYVLAEQRTPGFLDYFLVGEHWHRFLTPGWKGDLYGTAHRYPPGTIWAFAFAAALPWSLLLPAAALYRRLTGGPATVAAPDRPWRLYLLAWALAPLLFFTAARNIIWTYALPALPALALLGAMALGRWPLRRAYGIVAAGLLVSLAAVLGFGAYAVQPAHTAARSAKALVAAYEQHCRGPLIFVGSRPFSASFYSAGRAERVPDAGSLPGVVGGTGACAVIAAPGLATLDALPGLDAELVERIGRDALVRIAPRELGTLAARRPAMVAVAAPAPRAIP